MRGEIVYRVYAVSERREAEHFLGVFRSRADAQAEIAELSAWGSNGHASSQESRRECFAIREALVDTDFEIPSLPKPRDRVFAKGSFRTNPADIWGSTLVEVFARTSSPHGLEKLCEYERNFSLLQTFEPFRQGGREFALISRDYSKTAVLDLSTGQIIAEESDEAGALGFCPVGFYVPDWWDVHDGSVIPGSEHWTADHEWPNGEFGFVWGCRWGDDTSWKVQFLDLSGIQGGMARREERFGYVELATSGFESPCFTVAPVARSAPPSFIKVARTNGRAQVTFAVEARFGLDSGEPQHAGRDLHAGALDCGSAR
jgi:hypothetical protein